MIEEREITNYNILREKGRAHYKVPFALRARKARERERKRDPSPKLAIWKERERETEVH